MKKNKFKLNWLTVLLISIFIFTGCQKQEKKELMIDEEFNQQNMYNWSNMNEGPYKDKISYATSSDLLNWQDSKKILTTHGSVPDAIYKDGVIYLYFVDVAQDGVVEQVGLLISKDKGKTWQDKVYVEIDGLEDKAAVDPCPFLLEDGRIRLYYFDIEEDRSQRQPLIKPINKIYSAISEDGINFIEEEGIRFEREGIFDPDVIKINNQYIMYVGDMMGRKVIAATSEDGLNFSEYGVVYEGGAIPESYYDGEKIYLYTGGIEIASSEDGFDFSKINHRFQSEISPLTADPSVIKTGENEFIMFYKTN